jgi:two-component system response regulator
MSLPLEILLVEDNPNDGELVIRALKTNNLTAHIVHVTDGQAALDFLFGTGAYEGRDVNQQPKLVLLDLKLPKIGGVEVLRRIRAQEPTKMLNIVILTSSNEVQDIQSCYRYGANSYIVKPVDFELFVKTVSKVGIYWMKTNVSPFNFSSNY